MCRFLRMVSRVPSGTTNRCCARRGSSCHGSLLSLTEVEQSSATAESMLAEQVKIWQMADRFHLRRRCEHSCLKKGELGCASYYVLDVCF